MKCLLLLVVVVVLCDALPTGVHLSRPRVTYKYSLNTTKRAALGAHPRAKRTLVGDRCREKLRIATYNLYLGASLDFIEDPTPENMAAFLCDAVGFGCATPSKGSDPAARMRRLAQELKDGGIQVVGLQEVTKVVISGAPFPQPLVWDWMAELQAGLQEVDYRMKVAASKRAPSVVLQLPVGAFVITVAFQWGDAILVRQEYPTSNEKSGVYSTLLTLPLAIGGTVVPLSVDRVWVAVDVSINGHPVRFVSTHLESYVQLIRSAQATELKNIVKSWGSGVPTAVLGDWNSHVEDSTDGAAILISGLSLIDSFLSRTDASDPQLTYGHDDLLTGVNNVFTERIDYITATAGEFQVSGTVDPTVTTSASRPKFVSDHKGIFATWKLPH